ncbi:MAG: energy transducer TonB [Fluviicola sp.]|nr:energy transducer TonB [Fluviicola sp.]
MRYLILLLLSCSIFFASGQSARKQNKQLKSEYAVLVKEYNQLFDHYDSITVVTKNERELFLQKKKVAEQERNFLRSNLRSCRQLYEKLKNLEYTKDIAFSRASFDTIRVPDLRFSELDLADDRFKTNQLNRVYFPETMRSKKLKDQNVEYADYIRHLKSDTLLVSQQIKNFEQIRVFFSLNGSKYDSISKSLKDQSNELSLKRSVLDKLLQQAKTNYQTKGPNGFNAYYADYFPDVFPKERAHKKHTSEVNFSDHFDDASFEIIPKKSEPMAPRDNKVIYEIVDEPAEYPGGKTAMNAFLASNIKYPETALKLGLQGKCYLKFVVSENGNVSNVKVMKGVTDCPECDKEAIRVVRSMPNWKPAKMNGKAINSFYTLPINFML